MTAHRAPEVVVRAETPADFAAVAAIHAAAFGRPAEAQLVSSLRGSVSPALSLVAELAGERVGHVFFSPVAIEGEGAAPACCALAPVGVLPRVQGRGVGAALIREGLRRCPQLGWAAVFLLGEPAYYGRFGFVLAAPRGFRYESPVFDRGFQLLELRAGALAACRGWVRYPAAFAAL